jgi:hypothetical protein
MGQHEEEKILCNKERAMTIQIRDAELEARLQKQLEATGSNSLEELLLRLLENQKEQDRWHADLRREGFGA